jgi:hypothetical protein
MTTTVSNVHAHTGAPVAQEPSPVSTAAPTEAAAPSEPASPVNRVTILDDRHASVRDKRGRTIKVRRLGAIDLMRLFKVAGAEHSENRQYMFFAQLAVAVEELNGDHVPFPMTPAQLDAIVGRLDMDGLDAVGDALTELSPKEDRVQTAKN